MEKTAGERQRLPAELSQMNLNAAGINVGATSHFVAVPADRAEPPVREFAAFTADLYRLADWLAEWRPCVPRQLYLPGALPQQNCYPTQAVDSNQMLPIFRCTRSLGESSHVIRDSWPPSSEGTRCNASENPTCAFHMPAIRLIDTRGGSPNGRYVKSFVRASGAALLRPDLSATSCECYRRR